MSVLHILIILFLAAGLSHAGKKEEALLKQIDNLKREYQALQEKYQEVTETRWKAKQSQVNNKADNKEGLEKIRGSMEILYSEISRSREEVLAREQHLESEKERLRQKEQAWHYFLQIINDKLEKAKRVNLQSFPLDLETRMAELADLEKQHAGEKQAFRKLQALFDVKMQWVQQGGSAGLARRVFVLSSGEAVTGQVLRLGHCLAYAMTPDNRIFLLNRTGRSLEAPFEWQEIQVLEIRDMLSAYFPGWIKEKRAAGFLPVDLLQNEQSRTLIGGEVLTLQGRFINFLKAGGPVLVPLGLIVLWALFLIINRGIAYFIRNRRNLVLAEEVLSLLSKQDRAAAGKLVKGRSSLLTGILNICLEHQDAPRKKAEKAVEEYLLAESPKLDKYLETIAVLAAASPLLGLLGTVTGMIELFDVITQYGTGDPKLMAGGISEALITTEVGLAVAIPLLLIHNWLRSRRNHLFADAEMVAVQVLNRLWPQEK